MSTLEELTVVVEADLTRLHRDLKRMNTTAKGSFNQMQRTGQQSGRATGRGFATGLTQQSGRGLQRQAQQFNNNMDRMTRVASQAGRSSGQQFARNLGQESARGAQRASGQVTRHMQTAARGVSQQGVIAGKGLGTGISNGARVAGSSAQQMQRRFQSANRAIGNSATSVGTRIKSLKSANDTVSTSFSASKGIGVAAFAAVGLSIGSVISRAGELGAAIISAAADFEHSMQGVKAVTNATGDDFTQLQSVAKELGSTTMFSATEAANAMEMLGMAGWSTESIIAGVGDTLNLAAAGSLGLADAANITSNIMSGFAMDASESGRAADALAYGASSANVTVEGLGMSMSRTAGAANSAGWSVEQATAALGMFGNVGISAEESGTGLAHMLGELMDESSKATEVFDQFGVQVKNSDGSVRDFADIMLDAKDAGMGFNDALEAFGRDHGKKFATMVGQSDEDIKRMKYSMDDATGAAERMADTRMDSFTGSVAELKSAAEGLFITLADSGVLDRLRQLVDMGSDALSKMTSWFEKNSETIKPFVNGFLMLTGAVAGLIGIFLAVKGVVAGFGAATVLLSNPIGWVVTAVLALGAALVYAWKKSERFREIVTAAWNKITDAAQELWKVFNDKVKPVLVDLWDAVKSAAIPVIDAVKGAIDGLRDGTSSFSDIWSAVWDNVKERFEIVWNAVKRILGNALKQMKVAIEIFTAVLNGDWAAAWDGVKEYLKLAWDNLKTIAKAGWDLLVSTLKFLFLTLPGKIYDWIKENGPSILQGIKDWWTDAFVPGVADIASKIPGKLAEWKDAFVDWAVEAGSNLGQTIKDWWTDSFKPAMDELNGKIKDKLAEWGAAVLDWAINLPGNLFNAIKTWYTDAFVPAVREFARNIPGQLAQWKDAIVDWASGDGGPSLLERLTAWWSEVFIPWITDIASKIPEKLMEWTTAFLDWAKGLPAQIKEWLGTGEDIMETIIEWGPKILMGLGAVVLVLALAIPALILGLIVLVVTAIGIVIWELAKATYEKITEWGTNLGVWVAEQWNNIVEWFGNIPDRIREKLATLIGKSQEVFSSVYEAVTTWFGDTRDTVVETAQDLWDSLVEKVEGIKDGVVGAFKDLGSDVVDAVTDFVDDVKDKFTELYDNTIGKAEEMYTELVGNSIIPDMVRDMIDSVGELPSGFDTQMGEMSKKAAAQASNMMKQVNAQVTQMRTAMIRSMSSLQAQASRIVSGIGSTVARTIQTMVAQVVRAIASMVNAVQRSLTNLGAASTRSVQQMGSKISAAFTSMTNRLRSQSTSLSKMMTQTFDRMGQSIVRGFQRTVTGVGSAWSKLRNVAAAPVRYVINPVVNKGLRGVWNTVASKVPGLSQMPAVKGFKDGGTVDLRGGGKLSGFSTSDNRLAMVRDGEGVLTPSATNALGGKSFIDAANRMGTAAKDLILPGYSTGGVVGATNLFKARARNDFDQQGGVKRAAQDVLGSILGGTRARYGSGNDFHGNGTGTNKKFNDSMFSQIMKYRDDLEVGKGAKAMVNLANKSVGKYPEVPSGSNVNAISKWYGMPGQPWCAMFISWLADKTKNLNAKTGIPRTAWTGDYYGTKMKRTASAKPGDIAVYGTDHVNLVTGKGGGVRVGGNEGNNVSRSTSYAGRGAIFRPKYQDGGLVKAKDFVFQDKGWENQPPEHIAELREIFSNSKSYDQGGLLPTGFTLAYNGTGRPEPVGHDLVDSKGCDHRITLVMETDDSDFMKLVREKVRVEGGGDVQVAFGNKRGRSR